MDSQRGTCSSTSKRITRSWYPGRVAPAAARADSLAPNDLRAGPENHVGYWGRYDSQGEFESGAGFLVPFRARFPWRMLWLTVRRTAPLAVAALVGAITALAWQSYVTGSGKRPPERAATPAAQVARALPAAPSAEARPALAPERPSLPTAAPPPSRPIQLLGSPWAATPSAARRDSPHSPRAKPAPGKAKVPRTTPAAAAPRHGGAADPDAILQPNFL